MLLHGTSLLQASHPIQQLLLASMHAVDGEYFVLQLLPLLLNSSLQLVTPKARIDTHHRHMIANHLPAHVGQYGSSVGVPGQNAIARCPSTQPI